MAADRGRRKRITLADVAAEAGVSIQTASHVLSGNPTVRLPQTTRDRVTAAALKVGYRPNRHAQAIRSGRTNMVSVWMPLDRPALSYLRFLNAIYKRAKASGLEMLVQGLDSTKALSDTDASAPVDWPVDAVISLDAGKAIEAFRKDPINDPVPVLVFGYELVSNGDAVGWDNIGAAAASTQKLIDSGARDIAFVTVERFIHEYPRERRRRGYTETMEAAGLTPRIIGVPSERPADVEAELNKLQDFPEAVVCLTDPIAIGAVRAAQARGLQVPEQFQAWGYGDYPEAQDFAVPISTWPQPIEEAVGQAWEWVLSRIVDTTLETRFAEVPMTCIVRNSTR